VMSESSRVCAPRTTAPPELLPEQSSHDVPWELPWRAAAVIEGVGKALARRRAARIVLDDWLGFRLLVHDDELVSSLNDFLEFGGFVSGD
jgi:hypothetical protein